jgi:hypothetical protein
MHVVNFDLPKQMKKKETIVMPICMASYVMIDYGHANHAFRVNVRY